MSTLSASELISVWERGQHRDAVGRALVLLAAACPGKTREELSAASIGRRDAALLDLQEQIFAADVRGFAECPRCGGRLEYNLPTGNLRADLPPPSGEPLLIESEGYSLRLRLPNSADLARLRSCTSIEEARQTLLGRCVLEASWNGSRVAAEELPEAVISRVSTALAEADPQAELLIDLNCPSCGHDWQLIFDIASYLWAEINALAKRLLREVHVLARAYGWREAEILAMSSPRRQFYLEMVG